MKKSINISLIGLFTLLIPVMSFNIEGEHESSYQEPENQRLQDPFFHEDRVENLDNVRTSIEQKRWHDGIRKTWDRVTSDDHRTIANAFNTNEVPNLNSTEKAAFQKLTPKEQLEFCNEWLASQLKANTISTDALNNRWNNLKSVHNPKINKLTTEIAKLEKEKKDFENPSWLKKWWHGDTGIQTKLAKIEEKLTSKRSDLTTLKDTKSTSSTSLSDEYKKNNKAAQEKIKNFINTINSDLGENQLRYNTKIHTFELHKKDFSLIYNPSQATNTRSTGDSIFTGESELQREARENAVAAEANVNRAINLQNFRQGNNENNQARDTLEESRQNVSNELDKILNLINNKDYEDLLQKIKNAKTQNDINKIQKEIDSLQPITSNPLTPAPNRPNNPTQRATSVDNKSSRNADEQDEEEEALVTPPTFSGEEDNLSNNPFASNTSNTNYQRNKNWWE